MAFFKALFSRVNGSYRDTGLSTVFEAQVRRAIQLLGNSNGKLTDDKVVELYRNSGMGKREATELLLFLPIAFTRHLMTDIKWSENYIEMTGNQRTLKKYADSNSYRIIQQEIEKYFDKKPDADVILKIAGRSIEFNTITEALKGGAIENDLVVQDSVITRQLSTQRW